MTKQDKIKKVMDEFKRGTLKTPDGKVVKNRKQALAIAMSESKDYAEKGDLINHLSVNSTAEALDILKGAGTEDLFEKAKHQDGDMHPNGKWVWVASAAGGKGDWRTAGGRAHKRHDEAQKQKEGGQPKTTEEHAKDTSTETLKKVAASANAPSKLKDAAKKELAERGGGGDDKKEDTKAASPDTTKTNAAKQKKLRPVGTGTNGPERRRKETKTPPKPKYSEMSAEDLKKELVGKTLVEEETVKGKKTTRTYKITNVVKFRGRVEIEYFSSDEPYVHVLNPKTLEDGHDGDMYKYTLK